MNSDKLLEKFLNKANFERSYKRIARKGACGGNDGITVEEFGKHLDRNIRFLINAIREKRYNPQPVTTVKMPKFNEANEWRTLGIPVIADKVVQAAFLETIQPITEKIFSDRSYAYRPGKGHYKAIRRVEHILKSCKKNWAIQKDIDNFFDTLNHDLLISKFSDLVEGEPTLIELVMLWCKMGIIDKSSSWSDVRGGVRQGHVISPLLANLYLHPLDEFASNLPVEWVRYADNYIILAESDSVCTIANASFKNYLNEKLQLALNKGEDIPKQLSEGFTFLGIHFYGDKRQIDSHKIEKMKKKVSWIISNPKQNILPGEIIDKLQSKMKNWHIYYGFLECQDQFSEIDKYIREEFIKRAAERISKGNWKMNQPPNCEFPLLNNGSKKNNKRIMREIWNTSVLCVKNNNEKKVKRRTKNKVSKRRRGHKKEQGIRQHLVVETPGYFIGKRGERIVVREKQKTIADIPVIGLKGITVNNRGVGISGDVIDLCVKNDLYLHFADRIGNIKAIIVSPGGSSSETALLQLRNRNTDKAMVISRMFVLGKVKNQFTLLKYYYKYPPNRMNGFGSYFRGNKDTMLSIIEKIKASAEYNSAAHYRQYLMGLEGAFAAMYWESLKHLLKNKVEFPGREKQGAKDIVNNALNYGYAILYGRVTNAVLRSGLNPAIGFLHAGERDKPALVFDLIEEFRPLVVDRAIVGMFNKGTTLTQNEKDLLQPESKKKVIKAVMQSLHTEVWYAGKGHTVAEIIAEQALRIIKHLEDKMVYRPYLGRW